MKSQAQEPKVFVFGKVEEYLVFMPKEEAARLAHLWESVQVAKTWGELRKLLSGPAVEEITESYAGGDCDPDDMTDAARFDFELIGGFSDGDWPDWPAQGALDWVPKDIQERYGEVVDSVHNGLFLRLDSAKEKDIVKTFEEMGYVIEKNESLVRTASGH